MPAASRILSSHRRQAVYEVMQPRFRGLNHEEFWVVMLDRGMRLMKETRVSQGGTAATVVDVK